MTANELADKLESVSIKLLGKETEQAGRAIIFYRESAIMLRQQTKEIESLKNAKRFIQNFAEEQHQRAVALEMRELTDEEIQDLWAEMNWSGHPELEFARAILKKASEK
jgi:hypothetical protein